jgi:hypothetical protein
MTALTPPANAGASSQADVRSPSPFAASIPIFDPDASSDSDFEHNESGHLQSIELQSQSRTYEKIRGTGDEDEPGYELEHLDVEGQDDEAAPALGGERQRRLSESTVQSFQLYTPDEEAEVVRSFDRRLVVFVAGLYMLSFLDRSSMSSPTPHMQT